ncbi:MAG: hypothetical protein LBH18_02200, partial [Spirochaetaceae bacterium]|nr:hypothetical protein [Spirochaetaceae bacterium]
EHDFPQLVFLRVYDRLTGNISAIPDDLYGSFFETMIKRTVTLRWARVQKYNGLWAIVRRVPSNRQLDQPDIPQEEVSADLYDDSSLYAYFVICLIDKTEIEEKLKTLMNDIAIDKTFSRSQISAVNSIKSNFFNGF